MPLRTLPLAIVLTLSTYNVSVHAAGNIDGNNSDGWLSLEGGEYSYVVGYGSMAAHPPTSQDTVFSGANVELDGVTAFLVTGIANFQDATSGSDITVASTNSTVTIRNSTINNPESVIFGAFSCIAGSASNAHSLVSGSTLNIYDSVLQGSVWGQSAQTFPMHENATLEARDVNVLLERSSLKGYLLANGVYGGGCQKFRVSWDNTCP